MRIPSKKKKKGTLNVQIQGGMSKDIGSAFSARQQRETEEGRLQVDNYWRKKYGKTEMKGGELKHITEHMGGKVPEHVKVGREMIKEGRDFISMKELHPEEYVKDVQGNLISPQEAMMAEELGQQEKLSQQTEQEGDWGSEMLRKVPLVGQDIEGARNVLGKGFSTISSIFGADENTKREIEQSFGLEPGQSFFKDDDVQSFGISLVSLGIASFLFRGIGLKLARKGGAQKGLSVAERLANRPMGKVVMSRNLPGGVSATTSGFPIQKAAEGLAKMNTPMVQKVLASGWTKIGAGAFIGLSVTTGWLASDNILSGSTFSAKLVQDSVDQGIISKAEGMNLMNEIQEWNDGAESFIRGRNAVDPLTYGALGKPYLINAEKSQRDLALRKALLLAS